MILNLEVITEDLKAYFFEGGRGSCQDSCCILCSVGGTMNSIYSSLVLFCVFAICLI